MPVGEELLELIYFGPTDSTSIIYGNGYDKCGPLRYSYIDQDEAEFTLPVFFANETFNENFADDLALNVTSNATGTTLTANATLVIDLEQYPLSTPATFALNITYRECFPDNFIRPEVEPVSIQVGDDG